MIMWRHYLHSGAIGFIISGLFLGYAKAVFNFDPWGLCNSCYYVWAKAVDLLLIMCMLYPMHYYRPHWVAIGSFFAIRIAWEAIAVNDYAAASSPEIMFVMFILLCTTVTVIQYREWRRQEY